MEGMDKAVPSLFLAPLLHRIPELEENLGIIWSTLGPTQDSSTSLLPSLLWPFTHRLLEHLSPCIVTICVSVSFTKQWHLRTDTASYVSTFVFHFSTPKHSQEFLLYVTGVCDRMNEQTNEGHLSKTVIQRLLERFLWWGVHYLKMEKIHYGTVEMSEDVSGHGMEICFSDPSTW